MNVETKRGVTIVRFTGDITLETYRLHRDRLIQLLQENRRLLADLAEVRLIDTLGWALFLSLRRRAEETGSQFKLMRLPEYLGMTFLAYRFERVFELFDQERIALDSFSSTLNLEEFRQ